MPALAYDGVQVVNSPTVRYLSPCQTPSNSRAVQRSRQGISLARLHSRLHSRAHRAREPSHLRMTALSASSTRVRDCVCAPAARRLNANVCSRKRLAPARAEPGARPVMCYQRRYSVWGGTLCFVGAWCVIARRSAGERVRTFVVVAVCARCKTYQLRTGTPRTSCVSAAHTSALHACLLAFRTLADTARRPTLALPR